MVEQIISIDEFLSSRKGATKGDVLFKASKPGAPASWNPETRSARFVMSAQVIDRDRDVVMVAGIDTKNFVDNPIALLNHRYDHPIGTWPKLYKMTDALEGDVVISGDPAIPEAIKAGALVSSGIVRSCSIGFIPRTVKRRLLENGEPTNIWEILECELVECSIVSIPANPMALAKSSAGGEELIMCRDLIAEVLDAYVKDPATGLIVPKAEFEAAHKELTGNRTTVVIDTAIDAPIPKSFLDKIKAALLTPPPEVEAAVVAEVQAELAQAEAAEAELVAAKKAAFAALADIPAA